MTLPTISTLTSVQHSTIWCLSSYYRISTTRQTSTINYFLPQLSMPTKQIFLKQFSKIISFIVFRPSVGRELPHIQFQLESAATTVGLKTISDFTPLEFILKFETHIGGYFWRRPTHFEASSRHDNRIFSGSCNILTILSTSLLAIFSFIDYFFLATFYKTPFQSASKKSIAHFFLEFAVSKRITLNIIWRNWNTRYHCSFLSQICNG